MPTGTRRLIAWSAAAAVLAIGAVVAWSLLVHSGWLAGAVRQAVVTRLVVAIGRPVELGSVRGDPLHGVDLRDLAIAEQGGFSQGVAFSVDRIHVAFDLPRLLRHPQEVLQSITRADLYRPRAEIVRDAKGIWNLADLFTGRRRPVGPQFQGLVAVHDGTVAYADSYGVAAPPFVTRFAGIAGELDFRAAPRVSVDVRGRSAEGESLALRGRYLAEEGAFDLDVTVDHGAVGRWGGYLVRLSGLRWAAGRFGGRLHLLLTPQGDGVALDYTGTIRLADARIDYAPTHLSLRHVSGSIGLDASRVSTSGLNLEANGSPLRVRGDVALPGGAWLDLVISSPSLDLGMVRSLFFPGARLGIAGRAGGDVWVTGPVAAPYLDGDITSARGRLNGQAFESLSTHFQYAAGMFALTDLHARVGTGSVSGDAVLGMSGGMPSFQLAVTADGIDTGALPRAGLPITDGLAGRLSGSLAGTGTDGHVQVIGDIAMPSGTVRGQAFHDLRALFWDDGGAIELDLLRAGIGQTAVYASGRISRGGALDLALDARDIPLAELGARAGLGGSLLGGYADLDGRLTGTAAAPVVSGAVAAWEGTVGPVPFAFARGDLTLGASGIAARSLDLVDGATSYHLSGGLRFRPLAAEDLRIDAENVSASQLLRRSAAAKGISGTLSGHVTLSGSPAHPAGSGEITLLHGRVAGQPVDRATARVAGDGRIVRILSADAQRNGSRVHAEGTVDLRGPLDLRVSAERIQIQDLTSAVKVAAAPRGTLALSGQVVGTLRAPEFRASLRSPDLAIGGEAFTASGILDYRPGVLRVEPLTLSRDASTYSLAGELRIGPPPSADLTLDVRNGDVATIVRAAQLQVPAPVAGTIDGRIALTGPLRDPSARIALTLHNGQVDGVALGEGAADLTLSHGSVDIRKLELAPDHGHVAAQGRVVLAGTSDVEVSARDLDPNLLRPLFHLDRQLVGKVDFTMQWSGPTRNPTAGLSLEATDVGVPGAVVDRIVGLGYYKDGAVQIEAATIEKGPHKAVVTGSVPMVPGSLALNPRGPLNLELRLQDADLSFLSLLTPQVQDATGTVQGQVTVGGTVSDPQMSGSVLAAGGRMHIAPLRTPLENVNVDIAFSQDQILVRDLSARLGGGQAAARGTVAVRDLRPQTVALDLSAQRASVDVPGLYSGGVDAALRLAGPASRPVLAGTVTLSQGQVQVDGGFASSGGRALPLALDLRVAAGNDVSFNAGVVRAQLGGAVHVGGTLGDPRLSGTVRSLNGTITILGTPFAITSGEAVFSEALGIEPQIVARAQAMYGDTRVYLDVAGVLPNATLTWSSEPPMSQQEILALVLGSSGYNGSAADLVGQELGRILLGSVTQAIQRALHLDEFTISYSTQNPVTLRIGKFIVRNLYLSLTEVFGRSAAPEAPVPLVPGPGALTRLTYSGQSYTVFGLEYFLSPSVFLSYSVDTLGDNGIFLLTRFPL